MRDYRYTDLTSIRRSSRLRKQRSYKRVRSIVALIVFIVVASGTFQFLRHLSNSQTTAAAQEKSSPSPTPSSKSSSRSTTQPIARPVSTPAPVASKGTAYLASRQPAIEAVLKNYSSDTWGIAAEDLSTGENLDINSGATFTAASTTKLIAAADYLSKVDAGTYSLSDQMGAYTSGFQLQELVNQSDNDSWDHFFQLLGFDGVEAYGHSLGMSSYDSEPNTVTPSDMRLFLAQLYQGKLLSSASTQLLLSYMQHTEEERFLPSGIQPGATLYHKIGLLNDNVHDVGIIVLKDRVLVVAVYSNGNGDQNYDLRAGAFKQISSILSTE